MKGILRAIALILAALTGAVASGVVAAGEPVPEPDAYRTSNYRAPVPTTLHGAAVVGVDEVRRLLQSGEAVVIDVMPRARRPATLAPGRPWLPEPRLDLPGSVWLPNVGFGDPPVEEQFYFEDSLVALTAGERRRALVFYCLTDCWMSWNAAKRALEMGYSRVMWFPQGSDGWAKAGLALERAQPYRGGSDAIFEKPQ